MARPRKLESELKAPRRIKTTDGKALLPKGRPPKAVSELKALVQEKLRQEINPAQLENLTPLEYALSVMNNPNEPKDRRDRLCVAILPFMHTKLGEGGKRESAAEKANNVSKGKFAAATAPKLKAVN